MVALIDADVIMYRAAAKHEGDLDFDYVKETVDAMFEYIFYRTKCDSYLGFLTGKGNFRYDIATTKPYKGNRKDRVKPYWLDDVREYLVDVWKCNVVDGMEADDALGVCQNNMDDTIICSIDKDLLQIHGKHYNWNSDDITLVFEDEAIEFMYKQFLMGDSTDNIVGIPRVGKVKAQKMLDERHDKLQTVRDCVVNAYMDFYKEEGLALEKLNETIGLIHIARDVDDERFSEKFTIPTPNPIF
jgi:hypothetical protein